ncbi:MAG: SHOCT domain-containing protein [Clostridia bacterium]|nr:SHOCT domain-containing protein [Clostridia bacterium]
MEGNVFNRLNQEIEDLAKEKLSKMSNDEIDEKAKKYKNNLTRVYTIFGVLSAIIFISFFCCLPLITEGEPIGTGVLAFCIVIAIAITSLFPILLFIDISKEPKELALRMLKKEMESEVINKINETQVNIVDSNFILSKTIDIMANGWSSTKLLIDNENKKFIYQNGKSYSKTYKFSDLINYEVYENGHSKVKGRAGSALIGGAFFGLGGLIVGSSMSRNIDEKCNQLKLIIRLNDIDNPQIVINYIDNADLDKSSKSYRNMKENLQSVCSMLEYMLNEKTLEQSYVIKQGNQPTVKSNKEQLQELKEMLDDGLITQEDFEQKKKQILGL